jgi:lysylphosphatidylglycerol synthetase-like protein (DUF2156 family)
MNSGSKTVVNRTNRESRKTNHRRLVRTRGWAWLTSGTLIVALGNETNGLRDRVEPIWVPLAVATAAAVASVLTGCVLLVGSAGSTRRTVFRFRRLATVATAIAVVASYSVVRMMIRPPFAHLIVRGQLATSDVADLGCLAVALICLTLAAVGLSETWIAYREERRWPEVLAKRP